MQWNAWSIAIFSFNFEWFIRFECSNVDAFRENNFLLTNIKVEGGSTNIKVEGGSTNIKVEGGSTNIKVEDDSKLKSYSLSFKKRVLSRIVENENNIAKTRAVATRVLGGA